MSVSMLTGSTRRVAYFYDPEVRCYNYGPGHPMKPFRIAMVHSLISNYGLYEHMDVYRPPRATAEDMTRFHSDEYIAFLKRVGLNSSEEEKSHHHSHSLASQYTRYNVGEDCPVFEGLFEYCQISAGGSIASAIKLNHGQADVAINWAGGLHHAKRGEASGFCYVNDIVLAILELLKYHSRVLYIDIDVHHGDGVEEAFYTTDRVMTCSFHKYGEFFPGTGDIKDVGHGKGKRYAVNVPLKDGITDDTYHQVFRPIISHILAWYRPSAIVLQCGADSLAGDRLGCFNLTHRGHAACVEFVLSYGLPTIVLGGGGYTIRNVARCWAYETASIVLSPAKAAAASIEGSTTFSTSALLPEQLPFNDYFEYYGPDYTITVPASNLPNMNTPDYLHNITTTILDTLREIEHAPSVQMHPVPPDMTFSHNRDGSMEKMQLREHHDINCTGSCSSSWMKEAWELWSIRRNNGIAHHNSHTIGHPAAMISKSATPAISNMIDRQKSSSESGGAPVVVNSNDMLVD